MKNPWPYALTVIIAAFAAAMVAFVVWSLGHRVDLVAPDYYEREIRHQEQIDREERARDLPSECGLLHDAGARILLIHIPAGHAEAVGVLELYRPSNAALDRKVELAVDAAGRQEINLEGLAPGLWRARLNWTHQTNEYFLATAMILD